MAFHFRSEPWTQHLLLGGILAVALGVGSTQAFAVAWSGLVDFAPNRALLTGGLMLLHTVLFWPICSAFHVVDLTDRPEFIARHRIQTSKRKHPELVPTILVLLRNQFLFLPVLLVVFSELLLLRGWTADAALPTVSRVALELIGQAVCAVLVFYVTHRFLHRKWWMKKVHRIHHEFRTTTAFASEYAHPVEFGVGNILTMVTGALILSPHLISIYLFAALALITILVHHSGYALPWAPYSVPHDWHHYRFKEIFGTTGLLDRLLGTDKEFRTLEDGDVK